MRASHRLALRLAWRHLLKGRQLWSLPALFSVGGMAIGVTSLVLAMGVFSGYQKTLERAIRGVTGDLVVLNSSLRGGKPKTDYTKLVGVVPGILAVTGFVQLEGLVAAKGHLAGALLQGVDVESEGKVTDLRHRVVEGRWDFQEGREIPGALIGRGLATKFGLKIGDGLRFVLPVASSTHALGFAPKILSVQVRGILDLGKYDFDERFVVVERSVAQSFGGLGSAVTGYRFRLSDPRQANEAQMQINKSMGTEWWARSWQQLNQNVMQAAALEKIVIFFVVSIMLFAASLNVAGHLYLSIMTQLSEISILRAVGASGAFLMWAFSLQGLLVGLIGSLLGVALGLSGLSVLEKIVARFELLPPEVYRISRLQVMLPWWEVVIIMGVSLMICWLATLGPARRARRIAVVEGIRYE